MAKILIDSSMECKRLGLNGNEAAVLAVIAKCSRGDNPKGWYGTLQALTDYIPFAISIPTAFRALDKLLTKGIIEKRDEAYWFFQNENDSFQNKKNSFQNEKDSGLPYNPSIKDKNMEGEKNATCTHACDTRTPPAPGYMDLVSAFKAKGGKVNTNDSMAAYDAWNNCSPQKQRALINAVSAGEFYKPRLDWLINDFSEPEPTFMRGDEPGELVQVLYHGLYKICTRETAEAFGLQIIKIWKH